MRKHYNFEDMCHLDLATAVILRQLPERFSKRNWNDLRKQLGGITLDTAEKHNLIVLVGTEKVTYVKLTDVWIDPCTEEEYPVPWDIPLEILREHFKVCSYSELWRHPTLRNAEREFETTRYLYSLNKNSDFLKFLLDKTANL